MSQESLSGWDSPSRVLVWPPAWPSTSPQGWGDPLHMWDYDVSVSPRQGSAPPPPFGLVEEEERSLSPERQRPRSPLSGTRQNSKRGSNIFIVNCHGVTFPDKKGNIAMIDGLPVDIFTSVKFSHGLGKYVYNAQTCSFFDEPYEYFIERLLRRTTDNPEVLSTKNTLRDAIYDSLCATRDEDGVIVKKHCNFRCHHKGRKMADMYIMGTGSPLNEAVLCIDPFEGTIEDVHDKFGLIQLDEREITYPRGRKEIDRAFNIPIRKAERELDDLRSQMSMLSQPHVRTAENMDIVKKLRKEYDNKYLKLGIVREALRDALQGSKYRYKPEFQGKYDIIDGKHQMIKLSDAIEIAIEKGTIKPEIDFIVVQACRNFYGELPSGYDPTKSPNRRDSESPERGGGGRANRRRSRKKYEMNKGKNKNNKRKTIHRRKVCKSRKFRKSRNSRKYRKHDNMS